MRYALHNLYGVEIVIEKFGDTIKNKNNEVILVRDIVVEHLKEDLNGRVPSINDWLIANDDELSSEIEIPIIADLKLEEFILKPLIMSNLKSSLLITLSDFGIYLTYEVLGLTYAKMLIERIGKEKTVRSYLEKFKYTERWQYSPDQKELEWLKSQKNE